MTNQILKYDRYSNDMQEARIYFDNNATSLIDPIVAEYLITLLQNPISLNPSSIHADGRKARTIMEEARQRIAESLAINAYRDGLHIIFTSSGTEANNLAIQNFTNHIFFVGATEHISILEANHPDMKIIPVNNEGLVIPEILDELLSIDSNLKLVSIMLANNETGVINDIQALSAIAHKHNAIFHCDASQAFGKINVNFNELGCDLLTISSHKIGGPLGAAALIAKQQLHLKSIIKGGKQEQGLRAGTENLLAIAGFGLAASHNNNRIKAFQTIRTLRDHLEKEILSYTSEAKIFGAQACRLPNTSSIRMPNVKNEEQLIKFDLAGISLSAGAACSSGRIANSHVLKAMGISDKIANETIRVSLSTHNKLEEINIFIDLWKKIKGTN